MFLKYSLNVREKRERNMELKNMSTETRNPDTMHLDEMSALEIVTVMNQEDRKIPVAIEQVLPEIAQLVDEVVNAFEQGGRLIYIGAGTSGRLGVLDASECVPTFGVDENQVIGLIAGGDYALRRAVENAEDNMELVVQDLQEIHFNSKDVLVGIAASGRTPYVIGGLRYANKLGAKTAAISCNKDSAIGKEAQIKIEVEPGPEVLTGSTRLKSGTCQKMVLNMISTASMVRMGKAYNNLMVDVVQSNEKLNRRAENIVMECTDVSRQEARKAIDLADGKVKVAILSILAECDVETAVQALERSSGHLKQALKEMRG